MRVFVVLAVFAALAYAKGMSGHFDDPDSCFTITTKEACHAANHLKDGQGGNGRNVKCLWCISLSNKTEHTHPSHCAPLQAVKGGAYAAEQQLCSYRPRTYHLDGNFFYPDGKIPDTDIPQDHHHKSGDHHKKHHGHSHHHSDKDHNKIHHKGDEHHHEPGHHHKSHERGHRQSSRHQKNPFMGKKHDWKPWWKKFVDSQGDKPQHGEEHWQPGQKQHDGGHAGGWHHEQQQQGGEHHDGGHAGGWHHKGGRQHGGPQEGPHGGEHHDSGHAGGWHHGDDNQDGGNFPGPHGPPQHGPQGGFPFPPAHGGPQHGGEHHDSGHAGGWHHDNQDGDSQNGPAPHGPPSQGPPQGQGKGPIPFPPKGQPQGPQGQPQGPPHGGKIGGKGKFPFPPKGQPQGPPQGQPQGPPHGGKIGGKGKFPFPPKGQPQGPPHGGPSHEGPSHHGGPSHEGPSHHGGPSHEGPSHHGGPSHEGPSHHGGPSHGGKGGFPGKFGKGEKPHHQFSEGHSFRGGAPGSNHGRHLLADQSPEGLTLYKGALVVEDPYQTSALTNAVSSWPEGLQFLAGLAEGLLGLIPTKITMCIHDVDEVVQTIQEAFEDFHLSVSGIVSSLEDLFDAIKSFNDLLEDCGLQKVAEKIAAFIAKYTTPVVGWVEGAISAAFNAVDIYNDVDEAVHDGEGGDWFDCGKNIGDVISIVA